MGTLRNLTGIGVGYVNNNNNNVVTGRRTSLNAPQKKKLN